MDQLQQLEERRGRAVREEGEKERREGERREVEGFEA